MTITLTKIKPATPISDSLQTINNNFITLQQALCNLNDEICNTAEMLNIVASKYSELYTTVYFKYPNLNLPPEPTPKPLPEIYASTAKITNTLTPWPEPTPYLVPFTTKNL
jgi:hypothetical protein